MNTPEEQALLDKAARQFDLKALKESIEKHRANIIIFNEAIEKERSAIEWEQKIIAVLETRQGQ